MATILLQIALKCKCGLSLLHYASNFFVKLTLKCDLELRFNTVKAYPRPVR